MANRTRSGISTDQIIGNCYSFQTNQLPTELDVLKNLLWLRKSAAKSVLLKEHVKETAKAVEDVWLKTNIPIINSNSIIRKVEKIYADYRKIGKHTKSFSDQNAKSFRQNSQQNLFDIALCKCSDTCVCCYEFKVPLGERVLLNDQRTTRGLQLSVVCTQKRRHPPQSGTSSPKRKQNKIDAPQSRRVLERDNELPTPIAKPQRVRLENVARESQRLGVSTRKAATLLNAYKKDIGDTNEENIIDRNKIIRAQKKSNEMAVNQHNDKIKKLVAEKLYLAAFFDGKKDKSNVFLLNDATGKNHLRTETEDHYTIVIEPSGLFYDHVVPPNGTGADIGKTVYNALEKGEFDLEKLMFIGADGTNTNTGHTNGKFLGKWFLKLDFF